MERGEEGRSGEGRGADKGRRERKGEGIMWERGKRGLGGERRGRRSGIVNRRDGRGEREHGEG